MKRNPRTPHITPAGDGTWWVHYNLWDTPMSLRLPTLKYAMESAHIMIKTTEGYIAEQRAKYVRA